MTFTVDIEARDLQPGDRIWIDLAAGWWGPVIRKVTATTNAVQIFTVNGGEGYLGASETLKVERDPIIWVEMPYSEVCMHMQIAGKRMLVGPSGNDPQRCMAQVYDENGKPFSAPIGRGEAGYLQALTARLVP